MDIESCSTLLKRDIMAWCEVHGIATFVASDYIFFYSEEDRFECWLVWADKILEEQHSYIHTGS